MAKQRALTSSKRVSPIDKHVGSRVRMRRLMLDFSQTRLGDGLGITFQQVQKYEKGANRISASRLQQIADILNVPVPFFFEGTPDNEAKGSTEFPEYVNSFLATADGIALVRAFTLIKKPKLRRCIVDMVINLAKREGE
jgi:transcriptional regulator with XRE-family HTH domain